MKEFITEEEYFTANDIVKKLNGKVKYSTVIKYLKKGILKGQIKFGKWLIKASDYYEYINRDYNNQTNQLHHTIKVKSAKPKPPTVKLSTTVYDNVLNKLNAL